MSNNKSWKELGEEIRNTVTDAVNTGNFQNIGDTLRDTVQYTLDYTVKEVSKTASSAAVKGSAKVKPLIIDERKKAPIIKVGQVSNIVYKILGGTFLGFFGILDCFLLLAATFDTAVLGHFFFTLMLTAGAGEMLRYGISQGKRLRRALKYVELAGHNHYINVGDLALQTNQSDHKVRKDLRKMLRLGFFPQGHLDHAENCLMLDNKIYQEYLSIEKQRRMQALNTKQQPKQEAGKAPAKEPVPTKTPEESLELTAMIAQGQECIRQLREMNDHIPGEEVSSKLFRLENLLRGIFERLEEHPEQLPQMKKFMNYYLPTTLKLVAAYEEFDSSNAHSKEMDEAREEIERTLDTINHSFEELYARMFRDTAYDVTTDAKVLKTMLEQEGLGKSIMDQPTE